MKMNDRFAGAASDRILPFLWMMGEKWEDTLRQLEAVRECGIREVCLESRTFEGFCEDKWWETLGKVLRYARENGMRVWVLDEMHFPTGSALGKLASERPELASLQLAEKHTDVIGPRRADWTIRGFRPDDRIVGVVAIRRAGLNDDLTEEVLYPGIDSDGRTVHFNAPEGCWRLFIFYETYAAARFRIPYINMLDEESCRFEIDKIYEPHYEHVGEYFGKEFAGFFSDEPCLANDYFESGRPRSGAYDKKPGEIGLALPWKRGLLEEYSRRLGRDALPRLAYLWFEKDGGCAHERETYMDMVSERYGKCFAGQIGDWCRAHGVEYIGHIIEDMNAHARLSCSAGHYFRALRGQDMAGMDIVLHQVMPGFSDYDYAARHCGSTASASFYHYVLGQLAASLSHIEPHMKRRAMCEVFGAYGWGEDAGMMKWLTDFLLVRGINRFVPHAFSPLYPNPDCPPHFAAGGNNPQFEDFKVLMRYMAKTSTMLDGDRHTDVAVVYHAEAEWSGQGCMLDEEVCRELLDGHISYDIVPFDDLARAGVKNGRLVVGNAEYRELILPRSATLPESAEEVLARLQKKGLCVIEADGDGKREIECVKLSELARTLRARGFAEADTVPAFAKLRLLHVTKDGTDTYMLFNEDPAALFTGKVVLPTAGSCRVIDLLTGEEEKGYCGADGIALELVPGESRLLVFDGGDERPVDIVRTRSDAAYCGTWTCEVMEHDQSAFRTLKTGASPETVERELPDFAGTVRYTGRIALDSDADELELAGAGDSAELVIDGVSLGRRMCAPYRFAGKLAKGEHECVINVYTTLARAVRDEFTTCMVIARPGFEGRIVAVKAERA